MWDIKSRNSNGGFPKGEEEHNDGGETGKKKLFSTPAKAVVTVLLFLGVTLCSVFGPAVSSADECKRRRSDCLWRRSPILCYTGLRLADDV